MLECLDVQTYYGKSQVLRGISLKVEEGSVVAILGRNGMGKTTIIHSIIGLTPPRSGRIVFRGKELVNLEPYQIAKLGIGFVPQGRRIFPSLSVKENLTMAARPSRKSGAWNLDRVYQLFPRLKERSGHKGNLLSGGEQQMLAIGRALMTNPDVLLLDEPSEGLAPGILKEVGNVIKELNRNGLLVLLVEQNIRLALAVADYVYVVHNGMIVYQSSPQELEKNEEVKNSYIGIAG